LVNHLSLDVERFWFQAVIAGDQVAIEDVLGSSDNAWNVSDAEPVEEVLQMLHSLREIVLHVVTETATHAGHLDAARELIDGKLHLVLTE
jgi:hypothetical protein